MQRSRFRNGTTDSAILPHGNTTPWIQEREEIEMVLSDQRKRSMYDVGLFDPQDEEDEGFADFMQEMSSLMKNAKKEEKKYSLGEIQSMFCEMAQSFNQSASSCFDDDGIWSQEMFNWNDDSRSSKRARADRNPLSSIGMQEAKCV
ncbi:hypothetical protein L1987_38780 [Smallanthus sonchifolius]|uniref:Uncharacterized protein n=1 Tax=Smallanthus sonchifolius TaxID=185202 RepID=A0ACB9HKW8_9ASTR|nr:hypothetical protein L1987_38780 [Smallanthus sonchifolius]